ncbi:MAG: glutathione S-transferase [Acidobacteriota bacterium]|nr:MAG: glutathione S-transferase [Acidobacteriota bacterium]
MARLFTAEICPFAQRVRAVVVRLGITDIELIEVDLADRDRELLALSPTGRVPLLMDGKLKLYESAVVGEYLARKHGWDGALSGDPVLAARQRLLMDRWDQVINPAWYRSLGDPAAFDRRVKERVARELDEMELTVAMMSGAVDNLVALHCAPFWARMDWLRRHSPLPGLVDARAGFRAWLDEAIRMPEIAATLPEREWAVRRYESAYVAKG